MAETNSFIEIQFPVSKLSKESYKERKAGDSQTLNSLGKWHGRKPLVLVRALVLGLLLPTTDDPKKDRDIFLKLMTMDDEGMWRRCKGLSAKEAAAHLTATEREEAIVVTAKGQTTWRRELGEEKKKRYAKRAFLRMGYDDRLIVLHSTHKVTVAHQTRRLGLRYALCSTRSEQFEQVLSVAIDVIV